MESKEAYGKGLIYEVPEELKHEERVFWIFTFKQALVFVAFLVPAFVAFQALGKVDYRVRLGLPALILFTGFIFASVKQVQEAVKKQAAFVFAPKRTSWLDPQMVERYVRVQSVSENAAKTIDGRLLAILLVTPVDYSVLGEDQKMALVHAYRAFLNSLSFPVQVVMRTTKVNLREYFAKAKSRAAMQKDAAALAELGKFEEFVEEFVASRGVNDRLFYLVIPQQAVAGQEEKAALELERKAGICVEKLSSTGLVARRLGQGSLIGLYASFFGGFVEVDGDYLSILTMLDFAEEHAKLGRAGEKMRARSAFLGIDDGGKIVNEGGEVDENEAIGAGVGKREGRRRRKAKHEAKAVAVSLGAA